MIERMLDDIGKKGIMTAAEIDACIGPARTNMRLESERDVLLQIAVQLAELNKVLSAIAENYILGSHY